MRHDARVVCLNLNRPALHHVDIEFLRILAPAYPGSCLSWFLPILVPAYPGYIFTCHCA